MPCLLRSEPSLCFTLPTLNIASNSIPWEDEPECKSFQDWRWRVFFNMKPTFSWLKYLDYIYILKPILSTLLRDQNKISPLVELSWKP